MESRFLIIVLGSSNKIEENLNNIASSEFGVNYVDGNGIFIGTFYSPFTTNEITEFLIDVQAFMIFDITENNTYSVNLPSKYFKGLFPEFEETLDILKQDIDLITKKKPKYKKEVEEYDNVDDILDKLSRNNYDRSCLTEKEIKILESNQ
mgnify:CR=1 FL=1|jgi:hypothetical protein